VMGAGGSGTHSPGRGRAHAASSTTGVSSTGGAGADVSSQAATPATTSSATGSRRPGVRRLRGDSQRLMRCGAGSHRRHTPARHATSSIDALTCKAPWSTGGRAYGPRQAPAAAADTTVRECSRGSWNGGVQGVQAHTSRVVAPLTRATSSVRVAARRRRRTAVGCGSGVRAGSTIVHDAYEPARRTPLYGCETIL